MKRRLLAAAASAATLALLVGQVYSADHIDAPGATADPAADITDLYAWVDGGGTKLNLVLAVNPFATEDAQFSTANQFVFHVNSGATHATATNETQIMCKFYKEDGIECWAGDRYVEGDPSTTAGITADGGGLRVFAGLRNDPFFMEFTGFTRVSELVRGVVEAGGVPAVGDCQALVDGLGAAGTDTLAALRTQLQSSWDGDMMAIGTPADTFSGANVLALVVQVDLSVVNGGGNALKVWASTNR